MEKKMVEVEKGYMSEEEIDERVGPGHWEAVRRALLAGEGWRSGEDASNLVAAMVARFGEDWANDRAENGH